MPNYYTQSGQIIRNPDAYARTGAPMYTTRYTNQKILMLQQRSTK